MSTHGITLYGYCARWASGRTVEPLGTWDSTGQERLAIESASDEWQGVITATFWGPGAETGTDMLMDGGTCIVPPEALAAPGNGTITLRCTNEAGRRISVDLAYHSAGHAQVPGSPSEPTPDLWQQYVEQVQADADRAEQASKDAAGSAEAAAESAKQAAQATADISEAKDDALKAIQQAQDTGVQAIQTAHQAALDDIATDRQQALTDIETEGEKQTSAITSGGAAALEAIGQVEQTAIGQVQQAGTTQVAAVQQAGQAQQTAIEQAGQSWQQQIAAAGAAELGRWAPAIWDTAPLAAEHDIYAAEGAPLRVTQQGETEQQTTTGAQLFDIDSGEPEELHGGVLAFACPLTIGEKYTLSTNGKAGIKYKISNSWDGYSSAESTVNNEATFTMAKDEHIADNEQQYLYFWLVDGYVQVTEKEQLSGLDVMLNAGNTALPWEPYTGGAPSPSPDYPQAIKGTGFNGKVTFDGTETWNVVSGIYLVLDKAVPADRACVDRLGFCGRFPYLYAYAKRCLFFAPKNIDGWGTIFYVGQALSAEYGVDVDRWKADLAQWASEGNPLTVYYHAASGTDYTVGISTEDDAGGYHGQALAVGSPLYGDGSVVDTVANDAPSGCDKTIVLDGSEDEGWAVYATATGGNRAIFLQGIPDMAMDAGDNAVMAYSDRLPVVLDGATNNGSVGVGLYQGNVYVYIPGITDAAGFRAALAANPLKIWYKSTAYTEAADLHIDKVTRRWRMVELDGTEGWYTYGTGVAAKNIVDDEVEHQAQRGIAFCTVAQYSTQSMDTTTERNLFNTYNYAGTRRWAFSVGKTVDEWKSFLSAQKSAGTPVRVLYQLATPEEYASDPHTLPALGSLPETVKATGQSTVEYSADTKHYIDSKLQAITAQQLNLMIGGST